MRKLTLLSLLAIATACTDNTLLEPDLAISADREVSQLEGGQGGVVKMVPFKLKGTWWFVADGDSEPCELYPESAATFLEFEGTATHMGHVTGTATNCWGPGPFGSRPYLSQSGIVTAANGDQLYMYGSAADDGTAVTVHPDLSFEFNPVPFVGGTGRFENAQGWYHMYGDNIYGGSFTMEGEISSVGSSK